MISTKQITIIQNLWYCMEKDLKRVFALTLVTSILCLTISYILNNSFVIILSTSTLISTAVTVPISVIKKYTSSQWEQFMYALPIPKTEIVKAQFMFIEQLTSIYVVVIGVILLIAYNLNIGLDLEIVCTLIITTFSVGIVGQSLLYTNSLKSKDVTSDNFISFILIISASVALVPMKYMDLFGSKNHEYALLIHSVISLLLIMAIEFICYLLCQQFIKFKEF